MRKRMPLPVDPGALRLDGLPREIRLVFFFVAAAAAYYLSYAIILTFYYYRGYASEYLQYESLLLGIVTVLVTLTVLFRSLARKDAAYPYVKAALRSARHPEIFLLWIWLIVAVVNVFLACRERGLSVWGTRWVLTDLFYCGVILCPLGFALARLHRPRLLHAVTEIAMILTAPMYILGVWAAITANPTHFFGWPLLLYEGRLMSNLNPNIVGSYACLFIFLGLYRLHTLRSRPARWALIAAEIIWMICLISSASRGNLVAAAVGFGFYASMRILRAAGPQKRKRILTAVLFGLVVAVIIYCLFLLFQKLFYWTQSLCHPGDALEVDFRKWSNTTRFGGRLGIWQAIFQDLRHNIHIWIHGCGPGWYVHTYTDSIRGSLGLLQYTHNQFLEILVGQGIVPLLLYVLWLVFVARDSLQSCLDLSPEKGGEWTLPIVLLVLVVANLMEALLAGTTHYVGHVFFLTAGYVAGTWVPKKKTA